MDKLFQDLRFAVRTLRKSPVFTIIAVLCLGFGIATNTTLYSCFNAMILRPLPFAEPERLVSVWDFNSKNGNNDAISYPTYKDWRDQTTSFTALGAYSGRSLVITEGDEPARLTGMLISASLFPMLGVRPQLGRLFRPDEDLPGAPGVVLLSDATWRKLYAADSSVVGRVISVNNEPRTVVGIMPPRFKFPSRQEIWIPIGPTLANDKRAWRSTALIGRLKPGIGIEQANRELESVTGRLKQRFGVTDDNLGHATPLKDDFLPDDVKLIVSAMLGAVMFVLLIAVANVANLMLTRASARGREFAIRAAIGAGRGQIVRQLLVESVIIAVIAGVIALPLTWYGLRLIDGAIPPEDPLPYFIHWSLDTPTLLYTAAISLVTGVVFGLAPALRTSRGALTETLKDGSRGASGGAKHNKLRNALVVAEVALSLVLLVGASLFVRTFVGLKQVPLGFEPGRVLTMRFYLPGSRYDSTGAKITSVEEIVRRVEALPGVEAATVSNSIPLDGTPGGRIVVDGQAVDKGKEPVISWTGFTGHWFRTFGVALEGGRMFTDAEMHDTARVAIIDHTMAARFWPKSSALGQRFRFAQDSADAWFMVVGVTSDMRVRGLDNTGPVRPTAFLPYAHLPARNHGVMARVRGDPLASTSAIRAAIRGADPSIPVFNIQSMEKVRDLSFWQYGLFGAMFGIFGAIALFLAAIGVYGVISYGVSQRTREIGVRVALGAQRGDVIRLILRQGMTVAGIGIALGLVGAFGVTRVVASLLIGVSPTDPLSFASVPLFLAAIAFLASVIPARRATQVDPIIALRTD
ncbi:MAG TPA: ABC transporter permease [Gemmatimonadaceae bacterium]|nr:ABC transporter permease [Gemmatimonadaceae bacterium]